MYVTGDGTAIADDDPGLQQARAFVQNGKKFLDENVPGWLERARKSHHFEMITFDYDILAIACKYQTLRGRQVFTAGDVVRAFPEIGLGKPEFGFYAEHDWSQGGHEYDCLQLAWEEVLGRGVILDDV